MLDPETVALARFAAGMAHPARIAIVRYLLLEGEACTSDVCGAIPLAASTVCQHLKALRDAGIVSATERGRRVCYRMEKQQVRSFCDAMQVTLGRREAESLSKSNAEP